MLPNASAALVRTIAYGPTPLLVKKAVIRTSASGDTSVVAAVNARRIVVISGFYFCGGTVNVRFESGAGGSALTGQMQHTAQTGMVWPFNPGGWFETAVGEALSLELSAASAVDGAISYVEVPE